MDSNKSKKIIVGNKKAYYFEKKGRGENLNFHDYLIEDYSLHLVVEGGWHSKFNGLITDQVQALSIISEHDVDIDFIHLYFSKIKQVYIKVNNISNAEILNSLRQLKDLSISCKKSTKIHFDLPAGLKSFVLDWKSQYQLNKLPEFIEYWSINKAKNLNWSTVLKDKKNLVKLELIDCDIHNGNDLINLPNLKYLAVTNCKNISFTSTIGANKALAYIYFQKTLLKNLKWVKSLQDLDILILEDCGDFENVFPLINKTSIRGLWFSGNTKIINGDLKALETLVNLKNCFIRPFKHYTHKNLYSWNWGNFQSKHRSVISKVGK